MALDPQIQMLVDNLPNGIALPVGDPVASREMFRQLTVAVGDAQPPADLEPTETTTVPGATGDHDARIYRQHGDGPTPTILFFHGGGFVIGDVVSYDFQARTIAEKSGATLLSVDYRLAPEEPFPAGIDDAVAITRWALANVDSLGGDPSNFIVCGDSAGGNFAAVVAAELRDESPGISGQLLIYPTTDMTEDGNHPSRQLYATGPVLTGEAAIAFGQAYAGDADRTNPRMSPLLNADLSGVAPAVIATAGYDVLGDEGIAYAKALEAAGVQVKHFHYETLPHGFFGFGPFSAAAQAAIDEVCAAVGDLVPA
jgi:acetyl esterase